MPSTPHDHDHSTDDPFRRPVDHDLHCCPSLGETLAEPDPVVESFGGSLAGRRGVLTGAAALAAAGLAAPAYADEDDDLGDARRGKKPHRLRVTVLGTTDLHGNVFNWDYFKNKEYDDAAHNDIGARQGRDAGQGDAQEVPQARARSCCSTPATPSRARRWPTTTRGSRRSPPAGSTRWPRR